MDKPLTFGGKAGECGSSKFREDGVQRKSVASRVKLCLSQKLYHLNVLIYLSLSLIRLNFLSAVIMH